MSCWLDPLPFPIVPKSGPMRPMYSLSHMNKALTKDLPFKSLQRPHWRNAARLVIDAAATGALEDIQSAYDAMVEALSCEGWMTREPIHRRLEIAA